MGSNTPSTSKFSLTGGWLWLARLAWAVLALATAVIFVAAVWGLHTGWGAPCSTWSQEIQSQCLQLEQDLQKLGLSLRFYAVYFPVGVIVEILPWIIAGVLIFSRKSHQPFGFLFSLMLVVTGTVTLDEGIIGILRSTYPTLDPVFVGAQFFGNALLILWYLFPDGRFAPRWMALIACLWVVINVFTHIIPTSPLNIDNWPAPLPSIIRILMVVSIIYSFAFRYRRISSPVQRQQIKWVLLSASFYGLVQITSYIIYIFLEPGFSNIIFQLTFMPLYYLSSMFVAVSLVFSILRYRLWDIDFLINRSLVYSTLSILLLALFGLSLLLVSQILQNMTGGSLVAASISAVLFGLIFQPARRGLQRFVDQRFYNIQIEYQRPLPAAPASSGTAASFGPYSNLELLGRGGMGEVYKAWHPTLKKTVALKLLTAQSAANEETRKRFEREVKIASGLSHPNIVQIIEAGENNGEAYLVMEHIQGQDLAAYLRTHGPLALDKARPILREIASALDYAHAQGLVHRDIKPSNVMLDGTRCVLMDFGIAKQTGSQSFLTHTGGMLGSLDYIAPEQIQAAKNIDGRADIYALGVMAYQMLTGVLPFRHDNPGALLIAHLMQPPPDARELAPDLSAAAAAALQRAMAKSPEQRYASALEFVEALG